MEDGVGSLVAKFDGISKRYGILDIPLTSNRSPTSRSSAVLLLPMTISSLSRSKASVSSQSIWERAYRSIRFWIYDGMK